ncbi:MAG: RDD family protein [Planctomycetes bacterium]|nr:RDD family protein [Planctomycetota bacterium]
MAPVPNIPDPIRERLLAQQRRLKFVRFSFAVTAVLAVAMMFGATAYQGLSPSFRVSGLAEASVAADGKLHGLLIDQSLDSGAANWDRGSFRFARIVDTDLQAGRQFDGVCESVVMLPERRALVLFAEQLVEFDLSGDVGPDWPRVVRSGSLGIAEADGSPHAAVVGGVTWLCWTTGNEVLVRPLNEPDVQPFSITRLERAGAALDLIADGAVLWLVTQERKTGTLTLHAFKPAIEVAAEQADLPHASSALIAAPEPPPAEPQARRRRATAEFVMRDNRVSSEVQMSSLAIVAGQPVVALTRRGTAKREWEFFRLQPPSEWIRLEQKPPALAQNPLGMGGFMSLTAAGNKLAAVYGDGGVVKLAIGTPAGGDFTWESRDLALEASHGLTPLLIWAGVLLVMLVLLAGQGVWLLLNRQQELDKTLAGILAASQKDGKPVPAKAAPKLFYANQLARGVALIVDLLATSPIIILLKQVYGYEWSQAYGFLYFGPIGGAGGNLLPVIQGSLVTLSVLAAYSLFCELMWGRTLGKALLHLRVVNADGEAPASWQIVVRNLVRIIELAHWTLLLIPLGLMMLTGKQQRLGDLLARTYVIVDVAPEEQADDIDIG